MENIRPFMGTLRAKLRQASLLWLEGLREACCLHRVVIYCRRSRELTIRTGQCFLLNGFIFLGSIFILKSVIIPMLQWILPGQCPDIHSQESCPYDGTLRFYSFLRFGLIQIFYVFWFYPMYIFSFILSNIWYNDIAKHGFLAIEKFSGAESTGKTETSPLQNRSNTEKPTDLQGIMIGIAEQLYSLLLLTFFFLEVYVTGFIPYIGKIVNFVLLSWMYAYYCFEYKWNLSGLSLDKRLDFFESNWPFFAGFGCPCILAIFVFSPLVSYGVMAILYPLGQKLTKSLFFQEENGKAQDWEDFRSFALLTTYRKNSPLSSLDATLVTVLCEASSAIAGQNVICHERFNNNKYVSNPRFPR